MPRGPGSSGPPGTSGQAPGQSPAINPQFGAPQPSSSQAEDLRSISGCPHPADNALRLGVSCQDCACPAGMRPPGPQQQQQQHPPLVNGSSGGLSNGAPPGMRPAYGAAPPGGNQYRPGPPGGPRAAGAVPPQFGAPPPGMKPPPGMGAPPQFGRVPAPPGGPVAGPGGAGMFPRPLGPGPNLAPPPMMRPPPSFSGTPGGGGDAAMAPQHPAYSTIAPPNYDPAAQSVCNPADFPGACIAHPSLFGSAAFRISRGHSRA